MRLRIGSIVAALVLSLALAGGAKALTIVPDPVDLDPGSGSIGSITLVGTATGTPAGGTVLLGATGGSDISLIFQATATTSNDIEVIGVGVIVLPFFPTLSPTGAGTMIGTGDVAVNKVTDQLGAQLFDFRQTGVPGIALNQTSDQFFVSYTSLATDGSLGVQFMIDPVTGGLFSHGAVIIPEASTALLLGFGLLGVLGVARSGSRRRE